MAADDLTPGKRLDRFTLIRRIALGGMAEIWLAHDPSAAPRRGTPANPEEHAVALKILLAPFAKDPTFRAMFDDEVNIASKLAHDNIVHVYGAFDLDGHLVQVMELVDGKDLRRVLSAAVRAGVRMPVPIALLIAREMARALAYAHMKRSEDGKPLEIVHRDVSPHNVMLGSDGCVKLLDFGIARAAERLTRTKTGVIKGKVSYMAPEQALGLPQITQRADIFSAGIVLWEMLAMQRLFKADSDAQVLERVIRAEIPPIRSLNPEVPQDLAMLVEQMLAQRPPVRPESMKTVENTLTRIMLRHFPEEATSREALVRWVGPFLSSERTKEQVLVSELPRPAVPELARGATVSLPREEPPSPPPAVPAEPVAAEEPDALESAELDAAPTAPGADNTVPDPVPADADASAEPGVDGPTSETPVTPAAGDGPELHRVRLPTETEIRRAVDSVATVPLAFDPTLIRQAAEASVRVIDPGPRREDDPGGASAAGARGDRASARTPITELPDAGAPEATEESLPSGTAHGSLVGPPPDPAAIDTDHALGPEVWRESTPDDKSFEPVPIVAAARASRGPSVPGGTDAGPTLPSGAPARPEPHPPAGQVTGAADRGGERLYRAMFVAAMVVILLLVVMLLMKG